MVSYKCNYVIFGINDYDEFYDFFVIMPYEKANITNLNDLVINYKSECIANTKHCKHESLDIIEVETGA